MSHNDTGNEPSHTHVQANAPTSAYTVGTSIKYVEQCAIVASHAFQSDPLTTAFQREKPGLLTPDATLEQMRQVIHDASLIRLRTKTTRGALIAESGNFAAVVVWEPPGSIPSTTEEELRQINGQGRHLFASFLKWLEESKVVHLYPRYGRDHWKIALMARDPRLPRVPGAVRAVVDPLIQRARKDGVPIWLEAVSDKARDVYQHFGFKVVDHLRAQSIDIYCMILEP